MKKKLFVIAVLSATLCLTGCQYATKNFGGSMTIKLDPNVKLEEITWKDDSLWYLTRPMREDEEAETHQFKQKSEFGTIEGTVTVVETKE